MKKWILLLIVPILVLSLVGCQGQVGGVSATDIVEKTIEKSKNIKSMHVYMTLAQDITLGENSLATSSIIEMDYTSDPITVYQSMTNVDMDMKVEMYINEQGIFAKGVDETNQWYVMDQSLTDDLLNKARNQNSSLQLENLQGFAGNFIISEKNDKYVLELDASGEEFIEIVKKEISKNMPADMPVEELMKGLKINKVNYEFIVDKETFIINELDLIMDLELTMLGSTMKIKQGMKSVMSKHNAVEKIEVPKEVIEQAIPMN